MGASSDSCVTGLYSIVYSLSTIFCTTGGENRSSWGRLAFLASIVKDCAAMFTQCLLDCVWLFLICYFLIYLAPFGWWFLGWRPFTFTVHFLGSSAISQYHLLFDLVNGFLNVWCQLNLDGLWTSLCRSIFDNVLRIVCSWISSQPIGYKRCGPVLLCRVISVHGRGVKTNDQESWCSMAYIGNGGWRM